METEVQKTTEVTSTTVRSDNQNRLIPNALAIIAFIIVAFIVLWGLFNIASLGAPWLSSLFSRSNMIQVSAPTQAPSDSAFAVSWKYATTEKGMYAFLYPCRDSLRIETASASGVMNTIPCGAAYTIASTNNTLMLVPRLASSTPQSIPLTILFIPSATSSKQAQGSASVTIRARAAASSTPGVVGTTPPVSKPVRPVPSGPSDLSVQIISVVSDGIGGAIATFDISNIGQGSTGTYYFTAQLPTVDGYLYSSPAQSSLAPGDHIVNTLRFSQAVSGLFSVVADPTNTGRESNTSNNYASYQVSLPSYPQQYQY